MAKKKLSLAQRAKKDPKLRKRALANPGLRSKLPASMLTPELRQRRQLNARLNAPITPGSTITERMLAREATAAGNVRYGDVEAQQRRALGESQQQQRDVGGWYDQYLAQVAQHSQNVNNIGAAATQAGQGLQAGITGLGQAGLAMIQNPANADAAARGATAGNLAGMENQALAVRQSLVGSFVAQQAAQNAAQQAYADTISNVVAPGQKLGAMAQEQGNIRKAREDIAATTKERGAWEQTYRADRKSEEAKQVLAQQTLGAKVASDKADTKIEEAKIKEGQKNKYGPGGVKPNSYGFTYDEWMKLSDKDRNKWRSGEFNKTKSEGGEKIYTEGPFAGKSKSEIEGMSPKDREKLVDKYNNRDDEDDRSPQQKYEDDFFDKYGVKPVTTDQANKAKSDIGAIGPKLATLTSGRAKDKKGKPVPKMTPDKAGQVLSGKYPAVLVRVAMDLAKYNGKISASTAARLHRSGYSVAQLGLKTLPRTSAPKNPKPPPEFNPGGSLGGLP